MGRRLDCRDSDTLTLKFHIVSDKIFSQNASKDEELENQSPGTAGGYHTQIIGWNKDDFTVKKLGFFQFYVEGPYLVDVKYAHGQAL